MLAILVCAAAMSLSAPGDGSSAYILEPLDGSEGNDGAIRLRQFVMLDDQPEAGSVVVIGGKSIGRPVRCFFDDVTRRAILQTVNNSGHRTWWLFDCVTSVRTRLAIPAEVHVSYVRVEGANLLLETATEVGERHGVLSVSLVGRVSASPEKRAVVTEAHKDRAVAAVDLILDGHIPGYMPFMDVAFGLENLFELPGIQSLTAVDPSSIAYTVTKELAMSGSDLSHIFWRDSRGFDRELEIHGSPLYMVTHGLILLVKSTSGQVLIFGKRGSLALDLSGAILVEPVWRLRPRYGDEVYAWAAPKV